MKIPALVAVTLLGVSLAHAQQPDCNTAQTQADRNACAAQSAQRADADLNRVYNATLRGLEPGDVTRLRGAQRAWLQYRDLQCKADAAQYEGGSIQPLIFSACLATLTQQRTRTIHETYSH